MLILVRLVAGVGLACFGILISHGAVQRGPNNQEALISTFSNEAPKAWKAYREIFRNVSGEETVNASGFMVVDGVKISASTLVKQSFKRNDNCYLSWQTTMRTIDSKSSYDERVDCWNSSKYLFRLARKTEDSGWVMKEVVPRDSWNSVMEDAVNAPTIPVGITLFDRETLDNIVAQPYFKIVSIQSIGDKKVELRFSYEHDRSQRTSRDHFNPLQRGTVILQPDRYWRLVSGNLIGKDAETSNEFTRTFEYEYNDENEWSLPVRAIVIEMTMDPIVESTDKIEYQLEYNPKQRPNSEFTLSAYGIPEPDWSTRPFPWFLMITLAGFVLLLVGGYIIRKKR